MKPTIGITTCGGLVDYVASVEQAGGRLRVLEVGDTARAVIGQIDALLLTGGGDVDPLLYGEEPHPSLERAEEGRDDFEIDLVRRALGADLPILGICRGAQVLNVAAGGSLVQDIPSAVGSTLSHSVVEPRDAVAHDVRITPGTRTSRALGPAVTARRLCRVNSRHHQAVRRLGSPFIASATAPDGVVEAIEAPDATFCIGVQWHPENFWRSGEFSTLFDAFVLAAKARSR